MLSQIVQLALLVGCTCISCQKKTAVSKEVVQTAYIHKLGVNVSQQDWEERGKNGQVVSTLTDGVSVQKSYRKGILHGPTTYTFPHSQLIEREQLFENGALVQDTFYYISGMPKKQSKYTEEGKEVFTWYEAGIPQGLELYQDQQLLQGEYFTVNNELESAIDHGEGLKTVRDGLGHLIATHTYHGGQKVLETTYHPQGTPLALTPFAGGTIEGKRKTFYPGGEPHTIEEWHKGQQEGLTILFKNGLKYAESNYVNGKKEGLERIFRDGSIIAEEAMWQNGEKHGPAKVYFEGKAKTAWFKHGKQTTKAEFLHGRA